MKTDIFGQQIFNEDDLCVLLLKNPNQNLNNCLIEDNISFDKNLLEYFPKLIKYNFTDISIEDFDKQNQNKWFMPNEYIKFDIAEYILNQCTSEAELQRAGQELLLFQERDMFDLLRYLKYLVDTMRKNNVVWGVGRGSSVASFVLFLLGVHKINSLYYDLPVEEFFK